MRDALALLLRSVGLRSVGHGDPVAFLDSLPPQAIGCVVLDIRMPGIGGLDVLSRLAEQSDLPVIMLTGHANVDLCRRAFKGGAIEFLQNRWTTMCSWTRCRPPCARRQPRTTVADAGRQRPPGAPVRTRARRGRAHRPGPEQQGNRARVRAVAAHGGNLSRQCHAKLEADSLAQLIRQYASLLDQGL